MAACGLWRAKRRRAINSVILRMSAGAEGAWLGEGRRSWRGTVHGVTGAGIAGPGGWCGAARGRLCWGGARQVAPSGASAIPDGIDALLSGRKGYPPVKLGKKGVTLHQSCPVVCKKTWKSSII